MFKKLLMTTALALPLAFSGAASAQTAAKPPNIVVVMGDDIGWFNVGAYHRGIMAGKTPNLDKLAAEEGCAFTDYYAEASCTAGRANFITGELPIRTGVNHRWPGRLAEQECLRQGTDHCRAAQTNGLCNRRRSARTIWVTSTSILPTVHGFDEFFGYLYHLDAMEDPSHRNYPKDLNRHVRAAQHDPQLGDRRPTTRRRSALGQDRQAEDRRRRAAAAASEHGSQGQVQHGRRR